MSTPTKPILFSFFRSSCAWRIRNALALKNIDYEYRAVNLQKNEQRDAEFLKLNPLGQVPAMIIDGKTFTQSISILEYLEEVYPDVPLLPKTALLKAKVREICEIIGSGIQPLQNPSVMKRSGDDQWSHDFIKQGFIALEQVLGSCSGKYCVGDILTLADCCLTPQVSNAGRFNVDMSGFPNIRRINENLMEIEAFKLAHPSKQPDCPEEFK